MKTKTKNENSVKGLEKSATGIKGLDEITGGGLPKGRPTLIAGGAGSGKTTIAMEFLLRGAIQYKEPGVFVSFEENERELTENFASLGYDLQDLASQKKVSLEHIFIERSQIEETGEYDLEALFIRLAYAIDSIGAKRIVLDTIEVLFSGLNNGSILRAELRRLFRWLKQRKITALITGEKGDGTLTRHGLEEYVADCVIILDHRAAEQVTTRRLRVLKYRGTFHGTDEYPFIIDEKGVSVFPITSAGLDHEVSSERISTGIPRLDAMLGGKGFYRGSSILVSGTAGTGKTSIASYFASETCRKGERCLYFAFEESMNQIVRNMRMIGIRLDPLVKKGLLRFQPARPTSHGLETHLSLIHKLVDEFNPSVAIFDPITNFISVGSEGEIKSMVTRLIDYLKMRQITALFTNLTRGGQNLETTETAVSSLMDTWMLVRDIEMGGERTRGIYVMKSRGMSHSNQIREFQISDRGIDILDVYVGPEGVLTGSARASLEAKEKADALSREQEIERKKNEIERKKDILDAKIKAMQATFESEKEDLERAIEQEKLARTGVADQRRRMALLRKAD
ncbi:MAG: KaiC 1 [Deltaproteobacteria bacterium HGW-Deltaproteobacteria-15]|jgi:circadian clock protein KaiC|nr:MAG: KaiC 1 [Deltaproteobacteria bacterium HGW-Deltaproteobacteria-15]